MHPTPPYLTSLQACCGRRSLSWRSTVPHTATSSGEYSMRGMGSPLRWRGAGTLFNHSAGAAPQLEVSSLHPVMQTWGLCIP
jgi:hypothetical protein